VGARSRRYTQWWEGRTKSRRRKRCSETTKLKSYC